MIKIDYLTLIFHCFSQYFIPKNHPNSYLYYYFKVAVGMYRLGPSTASSILGVYPDIAVYGKMLSGGYMALAATLATSETFDAFLGKKKWHALLHGHSFTVSHSSSHMNFFWVLKICPLTHFTLVLNFLHVCLYLSQYPQVSLADDALCTSLYLRLLLGQSSSLCCCIRKRKINRRLSYMW